MCCLHQPDPGKKYWVMQVISGHKVISNGLLMDDNEQAGLIFNLFEP
jgi:hypothetical protein